jgi:hypothetical protein
MGIKGLRAVRVKRGKWSGVGKKWEGGGVRKYQPSTTIQQGRHYKPCKHSKQVTIQTR